MDNQHNDEKKLNAVINNAAEEKKQSKNKIEQNLIFTAGLTVTEKKTQGHSANQWLKRAKDMDPEAFKNFMESTYAQFPDKNNASKIHIDDAQVSTTSTEPQVIKVAARQAAYRFGNCIKISGGSNTQQYLAAAELYALGVTVEWAKTPRKGTNAYRMYELCEKRNTFFARDDQKDLSDSKKRTNFYQHLNTTPENQALQSFNLKHNSPQHLNELMTMLTQENENVEESTEHQAEKCFELLQHIAYNRAGSGWNRIAHLFNAGANKNEYHDRLRQVIAIAKKSYQNNDGSVKESFQDFKTTLNDLVKEGSQGKLSIDEMNHLREALREEKIEDHAANNHLKITNAS